MVINIKETGAKEENLLCTCAIQKAIDMCNEAGGGTVEIPSGTFLTGCIMLKSNVTLHLLENACLKGTRNPEDYTFPDNPDNLIVWKSVAERKNHDHINNPWSRWNGGIIKAVNAENVAIIGEKCSVIDGSDCYDEIGEEYYRGPHAINMHFCKNITLKGYRIKDSANWAHAIFSSKNITMENVVCEAGHDGIHITTCDDVEIKNCEFYTGDDCIAGIDNININIKNCIMNSACSAMRFGGTHVLVEGCKMYGPCKNLFRGSLTVEEKKAGTVAKKQPGHRYNMLSSFTYYADFSRNIREQPGDIIIRDCEIENADRLLHYNFSGNEPWQKGRPLESITFENVAATGIRMQLNAYGGADAPFCLTFKNCEVAFAEDVENISFIHTCNHKKILLDNLKVKGIKTAPFIKKWSEGGEIITNNLETDGNTEVVTATEAFFTQCI